MGLFKKRKIFEPSELEFLIVLFDILDKDIASEEAFVRYSRHVGNSLKAIHETVIPDVSTCETPLYVDDLKLDIGMERESTMHCFLIYALRVAATYHDPQHPISMLDTMPARSCELFPKGRTHTVELYSDLSKFLYRGIDHSIRQTEKQYKISRNQTLFATTCMIYTILSEYSERTRKTFEEVVSQFEGDLAEIERSFIFLLAPESLKETITNFIFEGIADFDEEEWAEEEWDSL